MHTFIVFHLFSFIYVVWHEAQATIYFIYMSLAVVIRSFTSLKEVNKSTDAFAKYAKSVERKEKNCSAAKWPLSVKYYFT